MGFVTSFHFQTPHIKLQTTDPMPAQLYKSKEISQSHTDPLCIAHVCTVNSLATIMYVEELSSFFQSDPVSFWPTRQ